MSPGKRNASWPVVSRARNQSGLSPMSSLSIHGTTESFTRLVIAGWLAKVLALNASDVLSPTPSCRLISPRAASTKSLGTSDSSFPYPFSRNSVHQAV
eukprot:2849269-Prymnesium_polylepis.4